MGLRGPKPKPHDLRALEGNPGRLPINPDRPRPIGLPEPPESLSPAALAIWQRILTSLPLGLVTTADERAFAVFCEACALHEEAMQKVQAVGAVVKTTEGNIVQNPWLGVANRQAAIIATYASRFGLTPSDRNGLKVPPSTESTRWGDLIG